MPRSPGEHQDIDALLRGHANEEAYIPQLHSLRQYDHSGYPLMRREFVDFLEAGLQDARGDGHRRALRDRDAHHDALVALIEQHPAEWIVYRGHHFEGRSVRALAAEHDVSERQIARILDRCRLTVDHAYAASLAARKGKTT